MTGCAAVAFVALAFMALAFMAVAGCAVVGAGAGSACDCCERPENERKAAPSSAPLMPRMFRMQRMHLPQATFAGASNEVLGLVGRDFRARSRARARLRSRYLTGERPESFRARAVSAVQLQRCEPRCGAPRVRSRAASPPGSP